MGKMMNFSSPEQFDEVISDPDRPALVDFWAEWCGPCKMVAPVLERLSKEYDGRMTFAKLNIDEFPEISSRYGVRSIPTLIIFRNGKTATRISGFQPEGALRPHLDRYATPKPADEAIPNADTQPDAAAGGLLGGLRRLFGG